MNSRDTQLVIIINREGVDSVSVHASDAESRQAGYQACAALEPILNDVAIVVRKILGFEGELEQ